MAGLRGALEIGCLNLDRDDNNLPHARTFGTDWKGVFSLGHAARIRCRRCVHWTR